MPPALNLSISALFLTTLSCLVFLGACSIGIDLGSERQPVSSLSPNWTPGLDLGSYLNPPMASISLKRLRRQLTGEWEESIIVAHPMTLENPTTIQTCRDALDSKNAALWPIAIPETSAYMARLALCHAVATMVDAKWSEQSYVAAFQLDESAPQLLPGKLALIISSMEYERRTWDETNTLHDVSAIERVAHLDFYKSEFYDSMGGVQTMTILGRGDFNNDGIEDLLLLVEDRVAGGSYHASRLYQLTRYQHNMPLVVLKEYQTLLSATEN